MDRDESLVPVGRHEQSIAAWQPVPKKGGWLERNLPFLRLSALFQDYLLVVPLVQKIDPGQERGCQYAFQSAIPLAGSALNVRFGPAAPLLAFMT